jgi:hypothetical protein
VSNPQPLPSLEEIAAVERKRKQAIDALEISDGFVKCQRCRVPQRIVGKLEPTGRYGRISTLQVRLQYLKRYNAKEQDIKATKQELDALLQEDSEYEKLRSLPLYCTKKTRYQFVCSECFTKANRRT